MHIFRKKFYFFRRKMSSKRNAKQLHFNFIIFTVFFQNTHTFFEAFMLQNGKRNTHKLEC